MPKYDIQVLAELTFSVDAPNEAAARRAITSAFSPTLSRDPLEGTPFTFAPTEAHASDPRLMTTIVLHDGSDAELFQP